MYFSQLSTLKKIFNNELIESFDDYLYRLTSTARDKITIGRIMASLTIDYDMAFHLLQACVDMGFMKINYAIRCPECNFLLRQIEDVHQDISDIHTCYSCGNEIMVSLDSIELIFSILDISAGSAEAKEYTKKKDQVVFHSPNRRNGKIALPTL